MPIATQVPRHFAPWAEVVPDWGPVTVDILLTLPDDGHQYEVVEGVLVRMAGSGAEATTIGLAIASELRAYALPLRLGVVTGADGVYKFVGAETGLVPDAGFYVAQRRTLITDWRKPIPFAPDLAVEVASPDQRPDAMAAKAQTYLGGGTRLVWIVWPDRQQVDVWQAGHRQQPVATLGIGDMLDGEDVVPGFAYSVAAVFADPLGEPITELK
ncbi:MAG TPA: Uma2 family endonuclease [Chloroflexota bacterium]|jgi:Uma2 family endonuclease